MELLKIQSTCRVDKLTKAYFIELLAPHFNLRVDKLVNTNLKS